MKRQHLKCIWEKVQEKTEVNTDVLLPTAYIAIQYKPMLPDANGSREF